jgi:hypothetical protein
MWASGSIVEMRAESYGVFLSQSAIRVERICVLLPFQPRGNDLCNALRTFCLGYQNKSGTTNAATQTKYWLKREIF